VENPLSLRLTCEWAARLTGAASVESSVPVVVAVLKEVAIISKFEYNRNVEMKEESPRGVLDLRKKSRARGMKKIITGTGNWNQCDGVPEAGRLWRGRSQAT